MCVGLSFDLSPPQSPALGTLPRARRRRFLLPRLGVASSMVRVSAGSRVAGPVPLRAVSPLSAPPGSRCRVPFIPSVGLVVSCAVAPAHVVRFVGKAVVVPGVAAGLVELLEGVLVEVYLLDEHPEGFSLRVRAEHPACRLLVAPVGGVQLLVELAQLCLNLVSCHGHAIFTRLAFLKHLYSWRSVSKYT